LLLKLASGHVRALQVAGLVRAGAIGLLGLVTVAQAVCVLSGGVLVDKYGTRRVGMLGLMLLALAVICIMAASRCGLRRCTWRGFRHFTCGAGRRIGGAFWHAAFGTLRGTISVFGIFGAVTGPLLFAYWSPETGYVVFLAYAAIALALGGGAISRPLVHTEAVKPT
jgi:MFS family permease